MLDVHKTMVNFAELDPSIQERSLRTREIYSDIFLADTEICRGTLMSFTVRS